MYVLRYASVDAICGSLSFSSSLLLRYLDKESSLVSYRHFRGRGFAFICFAAVQITSAEISARFVVESHRCS